MIDAGDTLHLQKSRLFSREVDYLGHTIFPGNLQATMEPTKPISHTLFPDDKGKLRSFLGSVNV